MDAAKVAKYELKRALEELVGQATRRLKQLNDGRQLHDNNFRMSVHTHDLFRACNETKEKYDRYVAILWANEFDKTEGK